MSPYMWRGTCGSKVSRGVILEFLGAMSFCSFKKNQNQKKKKKKKKKKKLSTPFAWGGLATWLV
jgi:hypothetical protein